METATVRKGNLHGNAVFYLSNPLAQNAAPVYVGTEAGKAVSDDTQVWIVYSDETQRRSYFRRELQTGENYDRLVGEKSGLAAIGEAIGMPYYDGHGGFTK
ncbi:MAG: hypothetical protein WC359_13335 [Dehalococcoidia bacterium]|jgi:hypothetical protein